MLLQRGFRVMRFFRSAFRIMLVSLCVLCIGLTLLYAYPRYREHERLIAEAEEIRRLIDEERITQERIIAEIENSMTDANIERIARERLGFIKSNEIIFVTE